MIWSDYLPYWFRGFGSVAILYGGVFMWRVAKKALNSCISE